MQKRIKAQAFYERPKVQKEIKSFIRFEEIFKEKIKLMEIDAPRLTKRALLKILIRGIKRITKKLTATALFLKAKKPLMLKLSNSVSTISLLSKLPTFI